MSNPFDLTGRTALVTGGNQGLGKAFAHGLADAGATVVIAARNAERNRAVVEEFAADGLTLFAVTADITDTTDIDRMVTETIDAVGRIDILVNNAGTCYHAPAFDVTDQSGTTSSTSTSRRYGAPPVRSARTWRNSVGARS